MSWDVNRVTLVGRLAGDVDLKYTPSGTAIAKFGLAVGGKPRDGQDTVSFFNIIVWGKMGENCSQFLSKGKQVCIDGRLEQRRWQAQDGSNRSVIEIIAERVQFLTTAGSGGGGGSQAPRPQGQNKSQNQPASGAGDFNDDFYDNTGFDPTPVDYDNINNQDDVPF